MNELFEEYMSQTNDNIVNAEYDCHDDYGQHTDEDWYDDYTDVDTPCDDD